MPAVCRGDSVDADLVHCPPIVPRRVGRSDNVFVNGIGISREGDDNSIHKKPPKPCPKHLKPIKIGSLKVKVNGKGCGRIGDDITACTKVASGSENVFAGG